MFPRFLRFDHDDGAGNGGNGGETETIDRVAAGIEQLSGTLVPWLEHSDRRFQTIEQQLGIESQGFDPRHLDDAGQAPIAEFLHPNESMARWYAQQHGGAAQRAGRDFSLGRCLTAMLTGQRNILTEVEVQALAEGIDAAGGFLIPEPLASEVIDRLRPQARTLEAGARVVPMPGDELSFARLTGGSTANWKAENASVTESDQTFDRVTLRTKTAVVAMRLSEELFEDLSDISFEIIEGEIVKALALKLDLAVLRGSGTSPEPRGIRNTTGVNIVSLGANGATPANYDFLVDAIGAVWDANGAPNAAIYSSRTARTLEKLKDTTNQPLTPPESVRALRRFVSNQIPSNLTQGTSTDTSEAYVADWSTVFVGVRPSIGARVKVLDQRYIADNLQVGIVAWLRADVALAHPELAAVVTGIRP